MSFWCVCLVEGAGLSEQPCVFFNIMFKIRSIDTETALIEPGILAPDIACLSWASSEGSGILGRSDLVSFFRRDLEDPAVLLVLHNGAFDMAVLARFAPSLLPLIFEKYDQGLIHDTLIQEKLFDIRSGNLGWDSAQNIKKKYSSLACTDD